MIPNILFVNHAQGFKNHKKNQILTVNTHGVSKKRKTRIKTVYVVLSCCIQIKTRMTTFIKTKFNKSDDQTNIDNIE